MRDAWEVTHPLAGGGEEEGARDPGDGCATLGVVMVRVSSDWDWVSLAISGPTGKPPGGLWVSGAQGGGESRGQKHRGRSFVQKKNRIDYFIRVLWGVGRKREAKAALGPRVGWGRLAGESQGSME